MRRPGLLALSEMVGETPFPPRRSGRAFRQRAGAREELRRFPPYWRRALNDLMRAYAGVCAYTCFRIHPATGARSVDHMVPMSRDWNRVYEWTNYRLACSRVNAVKRALADVLDPFQIENGWFVLELVGFQVLPAEGLPEAISRRVKDTIARLRLNEYRQDRKRDAVNYWEGNISLQILREESPFVAMELERQRRLRPEDTAPGE